MWQYVFLVSVATATPIPLPIKQDGQMINNLKVTATNGIQSAATDASGMPRKFEEDTRASRRGTRYQSSRGLVPAMEMLDPKRYPKPKKPMGNDIGVARVLDSYVDSSPSGIQSPGRAPDHLETTISIGYTMSAINATKPTSKDEEAAIISRDMQELLETIPKMPKLNIPHLEFHKDPEEEAINQRITEVARQLAEDTKRREYEGEKMGRISVKPTPPQSREQSTATSGESPKKFDEKSGKSFINANTLPLVSHLPPEAAQLQLIAEVQPIPQFMIREGFPPITPPPELIGPILGGPPLKSDGTPEDTERRTGRSQEKSTVGKLPIYAAMPIFLRIVPQQPMYTENILMSVPSGKYYPPIATSDSTRLAGKQTANILPTK